MGPTQVCLSTKGGSQFSFADQPIPADFFFPGSGPFAGDITFAPGPGGGSDTVLEVIDEMVLAPAPSDTLVEIELTQLMLVGAEPIAVASPARNGSSVLYEVEVELSPSVMDPLGGLLQVNRESADGGTYGCSFLFAPLFRFIQIGMRGPVPEIVEFDYALEGLEPIELINFGGRWTYRPQVGGACSPDFGAGVQRIGEQDCCVRERVISGAAGPQGLLHDVCVTDCPLCEGGACCGDPQVVEGGVITSCSVVPSADACMNGEYKGDGTDCRDADEDGVPDIMETANCSAPPTASSTGTSPYSNDTDQDTLLDGTEIQIGTDPCDATDPPPAR